MMFAPPPPVERRSAIEQGGIEVSEYCIRWIEDGDRLSDFITVAGKVFYLFWEYMGGEVMRGDYWEMYEAGWFIVDNAPSNITWDDIEIAFYTGETQ